MGRLVTSDFDLSELEDIRPGSSIHLSKKKIRFRSTFITPTRTD